MVFARCLTSSDGSLQKDGDAADLDEDGDSDLLDVAIPADVFSGPVERDKYSRPEILGRGRGFTHGGRVVAAIYRIRSRTVAKI